MDSNPKVDPAFPVERVEEAVWQVGSFIIQEDTDIRIMLGSDGGHQLDLARERISLSQHIERPLPFGSKISNGSCLVRSTRRSSVKVTRCTSSNNSIILDRSTVYRIWAFIIFNQRASDPQE